MQQKTKQELRTGCADMLRRLRESRGLSQAKMALIMGVDPHTYAKYERGTSAPAVDEFICVFSELGEGALRWVLDFLYPEVYPMDREKERREREAAIHFFSCVAGSRAVSEWCYILFGRHGSNAAPQLEEFCMVDHLPMPYRYAVAEMIDMFWRLAESRGELICTDEQMPDVELFRLGLAAGKDAAYQGKDTYTTSKHIII